MRIILVGCVGWIICTQACSCVRMILPKNPNLILLDFVSYFTNNAFVLDPFSCIHDFKLLFHMFDCLLILHMLELGFILCFPYSNAMNICSHVHA